MHSKKKIIFLLLLLNCTNTAATTHLVTNTNDSGAGSLRQAILDANADGTTPRTINFSIGAGVQTITPVTALPALTASQTIVDGSTQPGFSAGNPVIILDGTIAAFGFDGLTINGANNCVIQDLVINNGFNSGITIVGNVTGNAIYGCFVGTDQTGTLAAANSIGLTVSATGADNNTATVIGAPNRGNVISGNAGFFGAGMFLSGNILNTVIQGNFIGTDKTGTSAIPNTAVGLAIISQPSSALVLADGILVGGPNSGEGNVISGNGPGVNPAPGIFMGFQNVVNTTIQGNKIGVDITGQIALPNDLGMVTFTDIATTINNTIIGGSNAGEANIVSGNRFGGIILQVSVNNSVIKGNFFGTDGTGTVGVPNGGIGLSFGGNGNIVGGPNAGDANILSANSGTGLTIEAGANNNIVLGNFIGTDATGTLNLGNGNSGIVISGNLNSPASGNRIGGLSLAERNIVKFNTNQGISLFGDPTTPSVLNSILENTLFLNTDKGILLTNNANNLQPAPTILAAEYCAANNILIITATAPVSPLASTFRLEFFVNSIDRTPITEGERFIGAMTPVPTSATVTQAFPVTGVSVGQWVSATATNFNNTGGTLGDTSEFTPNFQIQAATPLTVTLTAAPSPVCAGSPSTLTVTIVEPGTYNLVWSDGFIQTGVTSPVTRIVNPTVTTTYSVTVADQYGCTTESNDATVMVNPLPSITLTASPISTLPGGTVTLTATPSGNGPFTLTWSDGLIENNVTGPVTRAVTITAPITYSVQVTDSNGCTFGPVQVHILVGKISPIVQAIIDKYCPIF